MPCVLLDMSSTCHACPKVFWGFVFWQVSAFYWWNSAVIQSLSMHLTSQRSSALAHLKFRMINSWRSEESPVEACRSPRASALFIISWKYSPDLSESNPRPIRFEPSTTRRGSPQSLFWGGKGGHCAISTEWLGRSWSCSGIKHSHGMGVIRIEVPDGMRAHTAHERLQICWQQLFTSVQLTVRCPPPVTECQGLSTVVVPNYCLIRCCRSTDSFTPSLFEY